MNFASAYRQLQPAEKSFTDDFVSGLETKAVRAGVRVVDMLSRPMPPLADERAQAMLDRPLIRAAIAERVKEIQDAADLSEYRVLKELSSIAFSNMEDYWEFDGLAYIVDFAKCTREQMAAVQSMEIEYQPGGLIPKKVKFKLHDKVAGLDRFMRHMGLLDAENPTWQASRARMVPDAKQPLGLPVTVTDDQAADAYARLIND